MFYHFAAAERIFTRYWSRKPTAIALRLCQLGKIYVSV